MRSRFYSITSFTIVASILITTIGGCQSVSNKPEGAIDISPEETSLITEMYESGMDELEIAETLVSLKEETEPSESSESEGVTEITQEITGSTASTVHPNPTRTPTPVPTRSEVRITAPPVPTSRPVETVVTTQVTATPTPSPSPKPTSTPRPTATPEPTRTPSGSFQKSIENEMVGLINALRKAKAVSKKRTFYVPIEMKESLRTSARTRSQEIVTAFNHSSASGIDYGDECIYWGDGNRSASAIVNSWKNSGPHYSSITGGSGAEDESVIYCGIGVYYYNNKTYSVYLTHGYASGNGLSSGYVPPTNTPTPTPKPTNTPTPTPVPVTDTVSDEQDDSTDD
ncbi:Uncharacterized conserved protein YkwD, contains CAP (CSP/antigen 5/PR1) domain [Ruminococcaceae bacterium YRB3002]|nr:Uncharacterized conserved protein YkwD, contains CAP (CSP/antigen 5/PR1) domain [Ruminococcaceae bacterium YRB3002]